MHDHDERTRERENERTIRTVPCTRVHHTRRVSMTVYVQCTYSVHTSTVKTVRRSHSTAVKASSQTRHPYSIGMQGVPSVSFNVGTVFVTCELRARMYHLQPAARAVNEGRMIYTMSSTFGSYTRRAYTTHAPVTDRTILRNL